MRSVATALAWEFWSANRRGWTLVLGAIPVCALLYRSLGERLQESDALRSLSFLPLGMSLILAAAFCDFTDRNRRSGVAGFPQHLFARPVNTRLLVTSLMVCAVLSVVGVYVAWVKLVYQPVGIELMVRWPATLLAAGVVFYQTIIWCMSGFRLTRMVVMSLMVSALFGIAFLPLLSPHMGGRPTEADLTFVLGALAAAAYVAAMLSIGLQRRGGGFGNAWARALAEQFADAIPRQQPTLASPDQALLWMEWRRGGLILPAAVVFTTALILGPVLWLTGRGEDETLRAAIWLAALPILLAYPIGKGLAKPDFWSLELSLPTFVAARPIVGGQIIAAKMQSAAYSTVITWGLLLCIAPIWLSWTCDTHHLREFWGAFRTVYSPFAQWVIPVLMIIAAMLLTWSFMVASIWAGYAGRPGFYYSFVALSLAAFITLLICIALWLDYPQRRDEAFAMLQPIVPWALAICVTVKCWWTMSMVWQARRRRLISDLAIVRYACFWIVATGSLILLACLVSPRVEWLCYTLLLAALLAVPTARIAAAPLGIAWNRHQ